MYTFMKFCGHVMKRLGIAWIVVLAACSNVPVKEIRSEHVAITLPASPVPDVLEECHTGDPESHAILGARNSIEDYGKYLIGYVEFDDQGWAAGEPRADSQAAVLLRRLEQEVMTNDVLVMVFVHGWHHNVYANDCNVKEFRAMVGLTSDRLTQAGSRRKVVGVYVGWRGESLDVHLLRYATIYTRKNAAEHVSRGSVRELFARLKQFEVSQRLTRPSSVRTVVVGHSFGGLIAFHSLAQSLIEDVVFGGIACKAEGEPQAAVDTASRTLGATNTFFPDLVVLINPAFEASRYEPLYQAALLPGNCHWAPRSRPRLIAITADDDIATGRLFPVTRAVTTALEEYNIAREDEERAANRNVLGFVERYRTHRLVQCPVNGKLRVVLQEASGGPLTDPNTPIIAARATPAIVAGHDGFLYSRDTGRLSVNLFEFLFALYLGSDEIAAPCD